ncbi:hypothetical protein BH23PAT2_BH23PAT2_06640 [soil metagenome]
MRGLETKKKQDKTRGRRHVNAPERGRISSRSFSYHSNRLRSEQTARHQETVQIKRRSRWYFLPSYVALMAIILCGLYVITLDTSPQVRVSELAVSDSSIEGKTSGYEAYIASRLEDNVLRQTKFFVNTESLEQSFLREFPEIADISIIIPLISRDLVVDVIPAMAVVALEVNNNLYGVDAYGRVFTQYQSFSQQAPVVNDVNTENIKLGSRVLPTQTVQFIDNLVYLMSEQDIEIDTMTLPQIANELHIKVRGETYIGKFDIGRDVRLQAGTFVAVRNQLREQNITPKNYVDVRVQERAFYR